MIGRLQPTSYNVSQFIYFCKTLYMFQTVFSVHHQEIKTAHTASGICQINTSTCCCSFELLMMDGKPRLKHVERFTEINKLRNVASCWFYSENILAMHGAMNGKFKSTIILFTVRYFNSLQTKYTHLTRSKQDIHM